MSMSHVITESLRSALQNRGRQLPLITGYALFRFSALNPTMLIIDVSLSSKDDEDHRAADHSPGLRSPNNGPKLLSGAFFLYQK
eukprot:1159877-Pelagomonas_calceolata.AAC.10